LLANADPPLGDDLYDLTGEDHLRPDWQVRREGIKRLVSVLFMTKKPLRRWPGNSPAERADLRACFPEQRLPAVVAEIKGRHAAIADQFECGRGLFFQRIESDIAVAVMLRLIADGHIALPLHDGFICRVQDAEMVAEIMREEASRRAGPLPVEIKLAEKAVLNQ
jgi:hypothetical protein